MDQENAYLNHYNISEIVLNKYNEIKDSEKPFIIVGKYYIRENIIFSKNKCLFCNEYSIINEGLCDMCKYYRYTQPRLNKNDYN